MNSTVRVTFYGAAGCVTGSKTLVEGDGIRILVDCGLFQGRKELRERNWHATEFDPASIDCVILTHAHIDHSGYLPVLVKRGFKGPIYCTAATHKLLHLLLFDAAHLQEEEARYANKEGSTKHKPAKPLFTVADVQKTLPLIRNITRGKNNKLIKDIEVTASCAGHILGSVSLNIYLSGKMISFSGDLGRYDTPILADPLGMSMGDLLVCESTYGDKTHASSDAMSGLEESVKIAVERQGALLIPSFAIGRAQLLLYLLGELERQGRIPVLPTIVDSPMAINATEIYREFKHDYDEDAQEIIEAGQRPLATEMTAFCREQRDSKRLNTLKGPRIIIAASGMATGGRVLHHLKHLLPNESNTVMFAGYQAEGTRGRTIQSGVDSVKIYGDEIEINAEVRSLSGLSAHGDRKELSQWISSCDGSPSVVRLNHGETSSSNAFAKYLKAELKLSAQTAQQRETVEL